VVSSSQRDEISRIVALARPGTRSECGREGFDLFRVELNVHRRDVLLEAMFSCLVPGIGKTSSPRDKSHASAILRRLYAALCRDRFERLHQLEVLLEIARAEARRLRRISCAAMSSIFLMLPVRSPRPSGE